MIRETSLASLRYNCIAWVAEDDENWWEPLRHWPSNIEKSYKSTSFIELFKCLGYVICPDGGLEPGYLKIAIYCDENEMPTHAARQLPNGLWTSKLGREIDIEHELGDLLQDPILAPLYGNIKFFMKRPQ